MRGGGLYALGFAGFFIIFEVASLGEDLAGVGSLFNGQAISFLVEVVIDSFKNTLKALMWPVYVVQLAPPWGAIALGLAFIAFTRYLKRPVEKWLFRDESTDNHQGP